MNEVVYGGASFAICGFNIALKRKIIPIFFQVYLTTTLLVIVSWVSFMIDPKLVPGRMGLLVTVLLVLINIFISAKHEAPTSSGSLSALEVFLVACVLDVFTSILEYALVLKGFGYQKVLITPSVTLAQDNPTLQNQERRTPGQSMQTSKNGWMKIFKGSSVEHERNILDTLSLILKPTVFIAFVGIYLIFYDKK